jgi:hypothetical protein
MGLRKECKCRKQRMMRAAVMAGLRAVVAGSVSAKRRNNCGSNWSNSTTLSKAKLASEYTFKHKALERIVFMPRSVLRPCFLFAPFSDSEGLVPRFCPS